MAVYIDETGRHQLAGRIDHAQGTGLGNIRLDRFDHTEAYADVAAAAQRLTGIKHIATLDEQVEFVIRPHCGMRAGDPGSNGERSSRGEKRTA